MRATRSLHRAASCEPRRHAARRRRHPHRRSSRNRHRWVWRVRCTQSHV